MIFQLHIVFDISRYSRFDYVIVWKSRLIFMTNSEKKIRTPSAQATSAQAKMMPLCVNLEDGTMKPLTSLFHAPVHSPYRIPTGWHAFPFIEDLKTSKLVSMGISLL